MEDKNQLVVDQMKQKRANYVAKLNSKISELIHLYKAKYEDVNDITEDTIAAMFADNVEGIKSEDKEYYKVMDEILKIQHGICKIDYINKRNKLDEDGNLDLALDITELRKTKEQAKTQCISMGIEYIKKNSQTINSIYKSFTEQNADFKLRYELQKELMCNKYGYTPESFDEYFEALKKNNQIEFENKGRNVIKGAYVQSQEVNDKFKHLLKKVENWNGEDVVYKSEFVEKYKEYYEKVEASRPRNTEGAKLYRDLITSSKDFLLKNLPNVKKVDDTTQDSTNEDKNKTVTGGLTEVSPEAKSKLREQRLARKRKRLIKEKQEEPKPKEDFDYEHAMEVLEVEEVGEDHPINVNAHRNEYLDIEPAVIVEPTKEEPIQEEPKELVEEEQPIKEEVIEEEIVKDPEIEEVVSEEITQEVIEDIPEETEEVKEEKEEIPYDTSYDSDKVFTVVKEDADKSILKTNRPDKLKLYRESAKYGRILYLPYSGYEVLVKRILNRDQLTYILELLQDSKLLSDSSVNREIMSVVYKNLEFFFDEEPTEEDFFKNLSIRDIPILITMMAMISQKEEEGKVLVKVDRIVCSKDDCETPMSLKDPITIDLKSKFKTIYPIDLYYANQYKFREAKYPNIYQAYLNSIDGKVDLVKYEEDGLIYNIVYGRKTYYNTTDIMDKKINEVVFQLYKQDLEQMEPETKESLYGDFDIDNYINSQETLISLQMRFAELEEANSDIVNYMDLSEEELSDVVNGDKNRLEELKLNIIEIKALSTIIREMNQKLNAFDKIFNLITNIRSFKVTLKDTNEVVINSSIRDLYELTSNMNNIPNELFRKVTDLYIGYRKELLEHNYKRSFITLSSSDIKGHIDINSILKDRTEFEEKMKERFNNDETRVKAAMHSYDDLYNKIVEGRCTCGNDHFHINHFNLLFFSITSQMGVKIKQD